MPTRLILLRIEVHDAVLDAVVRIGPEFRRADLLRRFQGRGASSRTLTRWANEPIKSGAANQHLARQIRTAMRERADQEVDLSPAAAAAADVLAVLPRPISADEFAASGPLSLHSRLAEIFRTLNAVAARARYPDGSIRYPRMALATCAAIRRCIETAIRLQASCQALVEVECFHQAVFDVLSEEAPEMVEKIVIRLRQTSEARMTNRGW